MRRSLPACAEAVSKLPDSGAETDDREEEGVMNLSTELRVCYHQV